jgi:WD40 repeat protein
VRLWDPLIGASFGEPLTGHSAEVSGVAFGALGDGRLLLASGSYDGTVRLWDPLIGASFGEPLTGHSAEVSGVAFGALGDGRLLLASGSYDGTVRLWDPLTGTAVGEPLTGHSAQISGIAFDTSPLLDGRLSLATLGYDQTVRLWSVWLDGARTILMRLLAPLEPSAVAFINGGMVVATNLGLAAIPVRTGGP